MRSACAVATAMRAAASLHHVRPASLVEKMGTSTLDSVTRVQASV
jgi:hypothetical protein